MIFRVDEDGVVRARRHAGLATNADRLIEIDDAIGAFEHRCRRTSCDARSMSTLIAACHLMSAARLGKNSNFNMLDVGSRYRDGNDVF